jgi:putative transposase
MGTKMSVEPKVRPTGIGVLVEHVRDWVGWCNTAHEHSALGGLTPAQAWEDDPTPLGRVAPTRLRHLLLAEAERTVGKNGVRWEGMCYLAPELHRRGGERVQIRYSPTTTAPSRSTPAASTCAPPTPRRT